ncbi:helix-turn-helix transcriptional regulator [Streptomyces vinaceus]|uniref:helix-turn-helix transcriptional regulator n=1 Tax=Streptomyces vinaceus TaxID=1960 RepID=UPI0038281E25
MSHRVPVLVKALDTISEMGVIASLRSRPEVQLVSPEEADNDTVAVLVVETLDDAAAALSRSVRSKGMNRIVLVSSQLDDDSVLAAAEAGIGALARRSDLTPEGLARTVVAASQDEGVVPQDLLGRLMKQVSKMHHQVVTPRGLRFTGLSSREADVLRLVAQGFDTNEIASELCYSERTVKNTLHAVNSRFHLRNRPHAVAYAIREGLI